jgi:hypothetical protein
MGRVVGCRVRVGPSTSIATAAPACVVLHRLGGIFKEGTLGAHATYDSTPIVEGQAVGGDEGSGAVFQHFRNLV